MRTSLLPRLALSALLAATTACTTTPADELAGEGDADPGDGKLDASGTSGFYVARRVVARCLEPSCRGVELARVNRSTTRCADGSTAAACLVPDPTIDWSATELTGEQLAGLHARMPYGPGPGTAAPILLRGAFEDGTFVVREVWSSGARDAEVAGVAVRVNSVETGACEGCTTLREAKLNSSLTAELGDLDLESIAIDPLERALLNELLVDPASPGVIIAGDRYELADGAKSRTVDHYWLRITP